MVLEGWHSIIDAQNILACSDDTIRRQIKAGKLEAKRVGGKWLVYIPGSEDSGRPIPDESSAPESEADSAESYAKVAEEAAETLRMQLESMRQERDQARNAERWMRERVEALELALTVERDARIEERRRTDALALAAIPRQLEDAQTPRPWWKRFFA